jgi:copper chaperone NosL
VTRGARLGAATLALAWGAAACARSEKLAPPVVRYGEDVCSACGMIVSEEPHAAAAAVDPGDGRAETRIYDDIGCMVRDGGAARFLARWVHDLEDARWIAADSAAFVSNERLQTPMGSGVAAFATRARADDYAAREGGIATNWQELSQEESP